MKEFKSAGFHWLLQRITAIYLAFGLFVHFLYIHYLSNREIDWDSIVERLQSPWWILFDITLLAAAFYHALNGIRGILYDYIVHKGARKYISWFLLFVGLVSFILGLFILDPLTKGS